jgi:hypothetical protein
MSTLTEADVLDRNAERVQALRNEHPDFFAAEVKQMLAEIREAHRQDWLLYYGQQEEAGLSPATVRRRAIIDGMDAYVRSAVGWCVTVKMIQEAVTPTPSVPNVLRYAEDHPSLMAPLYDGVWRVANAAAERAAAGRPTVKPIDLNAAMKHITGH